MVANLILNSEPKGEFFIYLAGDEDFLVRREDLLKIGIRSPEGKVVELGGEAYLSLKSMKGISFVFDPKAVTLKIQASPELLGEQTINFLPQRQPNVYYPSDSSVFLNYRLDYAASNGLHFENLTATNELGARWGDFLFLTDSVYRKYSSEDQFTRLQSQIIYDRREDLQRFVAGDFFASSGELGSSVNLGGLSFSKIYQMNPYFIRYPLMNFKENPCPPR